MPNSVMFTATGSLTTTNFGWVFGAGVVPRGEAAPAGALRLVDQVGRAAAEVGVVRAA